MKHEITFFKTLTTTAMSVLTAFFGALAIPIVLMVICNITDYITGLLASTNRQDGGISSYKSMKGIIKKLMMWVLVIVGVIMDQLLLYTAEAIGLVIQLDFMISCVVAIWIICNEIISILENIIDIGVTLPPFLMPLVSKIKSQIEQKTTIEEKESEEI